MRSHSFSLDSFSPFRSLHSLCCLSSHENPTKTNQTKCMWLDGRPVEKEKRECEREHRIRVSVSVSVSVSEREEERKSSLSFKRKCQHTF
jgi:hypothetical protein